MRNFGSLGALLWLLLSGPLPAQESVEFEATDGHALKGTLWSGEKGAPGVLLLHQCDSDQRMYRELGSRLAAAGLHALSFDLRGIGESTGDEYDIRRGPEREFWPRVEGKFPKDILAALRILQQVPGVDGTRIGVLGASCGGSQAIDLAMAPKTASAIQALVFLSSRQSPQQVARLAPRDAGTPTFWIAAEDDRRAAEAARLGRQRSRHVGSRLRIYPGRDHGALLFQKHPELLDEITRWFQRHLPPGDLRSPPPADRRAPGAIPP